MSPDCWWTSEVPSIVCSPPRRGRAGATSVKRADKPVGDMLDIHLNGEHVLVDRPLPRVPEFGPMGLQAHGSGIQFANNFVRPITNGE